MTSDNVTATGIITVAEPRPLQPDPASEPPAEPTQPFTSDTFEASPPSPSSDVKAISKAVEDPELAAPAQTPELVASVDYSQLSPSAELPELLASVDYTELSTAAQDREASVSAEDREASVSAQDREVSVSAQDREASTFVEDRERSDSVRERRRSELEREQPPDSQPTAGQLPVMAPERDLLLRQRVYQELRKYEDANAISENAQLRTLGSQLISDPSAAADTVEGGAVDADDERA